MVRHGAPRWSACHTLAVDGEAHHQVDGPHSDALAVDDDRERVVVGGSGAGKHVDLLEGTRHKHFLCRELFYNTLA